MKSRAESRVFFTSLRLTHIGSDLAVDIDVSLNGDRAIGVGLMVLIVLQLRQLSETSRTGISVKPDVGSDFDFSGL